MSRHFDPRVISEVKTKLKALEPAQRLMTAREAVEELAPEIRTAMSRGYTLEEIASLIGANMEIAPNTVKGYLYGKKPDGKARKAAKTVLRSA